MATPPEDFAELKQRLRATWMAGDFGQIAQRNEHEAESFIRRLNLKPGAKMLDVACGTGNTSIPAARAGAQVIGIDIAPNLLEQARQRAAAENLKIEFVEADAEKLPYAAGQFDVVISMFGAMFAPRPDVVASELKRVCRPGGLIAMANWTPEGFVGQMFQVTARHATPRPRPACSLPRCGVSRKLWRSASAQTCACRPPSRNFSSTIHLVPRMR
jgi:ubiquinone/menaquinone biosynthesis C-methylase UbiE